MDFAQSFQYFCLSALLIHVLQFLLYLKPIQALQNHFVEHKKKPIKSFQIFLYYIEHYYKKKHSMIWNGYGFMIFCSYSFLADDFLEDHWFPFAKAQNIPYFIPVRLLIYFFMCIMAMLKTKKSSNQSFFACVYVSKYIMAFLCEQILTSLNFKKVHFY